MKQRLKEPFGKAGLTVAILALVMALAGGAYAAGGLTKAQEKQVTKIAKKYAGKPGANGANGAPGATGPAGPEGPPGTNGKNGTNGESVKLAAAAESECAEGGTKLSVGASSQHICNGSPWTAGGTLPKGQTEVGAWALAVPAENPEFHLTLARSSISFGIPLSAAPQAHYLKPGEQETTECPGTALRPEAKEGQLCVYAQAAVPSAELEGIVATPLGTVGALVGANGAPSGGAAFGTWAVTAE